MTLATHILVAGAVTKPFLGRVNNLLIFVISIFSHYLSDAITHYDYNLASIEWKEGEKQNSRVVPNLQLIVLDLLNIAIDVAIGTTVLILCSRPEINSQNFAAYSLIVLGSILPDALQPIFIMYKKFPMDLIQNFHDFWHSKTKFKTGLKDFYNNELRIKINKTVLFSQIAIFITAAVVNYFY